MTDTGSEGKSVLANDAGQMIRDTRQAALVLRMDRRRRSGPSERRPQPLPPGLFDPDDLAILRLAYDEACAFFGGDAGPAKRRHIAMAIILHARRGLRDPHRLALKAIVLA